MINKLIVKNMFSDHGRIKLKINKEKIIKSPSILKWNIIHQPIDKIIYSVNEKILWIKSLWNLTSKNSLM